MSKHNHIVPHHVEETLPIDILEESVAPIYEEERTMLPITSESTIDSATHPEVDSTNDSVIVMSSQEYYRKIGFWAGLKSRSEALEEHGDLLESKRADFHNSVDALEKHTEREVQRFENYLDEINVEIEEVKAKISTHLASKQELIIELQNKQYEIVELEKELREKFKDLYKDRKTFYQKRIQNRLDELHEELNKFIQNNLILSEKESELNKTIFSEKPNQLSNEKRIKRFEEFRTRVRNKLDQIQPKIHVLYEMGITKNTAGFLNAIGYLAVLAAGWFFAVFWIKKKIEGDDFLSLIISNFFSFSGRLFYGESAEVSAAGISQIFVVLILGLLSLLALISLVVLICQLCINLASFGKAFPKSKLMVGITEDRTLSYVEFDPQTYKTLLISWFYILPYLFSAGLVLIIIALCSQGDTRWDDIAHATSAELYGTAIAFVASGIIYLYINFIVEPRWINISKKYKRDNEVKRFDWILANWELALVSITFFVSLFLLMLDQEGHLIALTQYTISVLFAAFTLAYGIKFRGLIELEENLELKLNNLGRAIEKESRPKLMDLNVIQNRDFKQQFKACQKDMINLIRQKNHAELLQMKPQFVNAQNNLKTQLKLNYIDLQYFPEYVKEIEFIENNIEKKEQQTVELQSKINELELEKTNYSQEKQAHLEKLKKRRRNYKKVINDLYKRKEDEFQELQANMYMRELWIQEGFDLGIWYRENQLGPQHS